MTEADPLKEDKPVVSSLPGEVPTDAIPEQLPTETEPTPPETPETQAPTLEDIMKVLLKHQDEVDKQLESLRYNQDADKGMLLQHDGILRKLNDMLDKQLAQQTAQISTTANPTPGMSIGGFSLSDIMGIVKQVGLGGGEADPMAAIYKQIGQKVFDGTVDSTVKRITRSLGTETAGHVVVDGHS
jgi:hypothetical protein